jgi:CARDB protein
LSFLDEQDDPPRRTIRRPGGGPPTDRQTLMVRRAVAAGAGFLVLLLLVLGVRGCLSSRKERAFKDYVQDATALQNESIQQSDGFFKLLREPSGQSAVQIQAAANGFHVQAEQLVDRARNTDHPGELDGGHNALVEALEFRRDGLGAIARLLPTALGDQGRSKATASIAAQMRNFDASDVIYTERFVPRLLDTLESEDLLDDVPVPEELKNPDKGFLPEIDWLRPTTVADRISRIRGSGGGTAATPGLHGTGLGTVIVKPGGQTLTAGGATAIKVSENLAFDVQISNQGENDEKNVTAKITISGGKRIELEDQLDTIAAGETKTVSIPLAETPPTGKPVTVRVEIDAVPGEQKTDNNKASFQAIFTR